MRYKIAVNVVVVPPDAVVNILKHVVVNIIRIVCAAHHVLGSIGAVCYVEAKGCNRTAIGSHRESTAIVLCPTPTKVMGPAVKIHPLGHIVGICNLYTFLSLGNETEASGLDIVDGGISRVKLSLSAAPALRALTVEDRARPR